MTLYHQFLLVYGFFVVVALGHVGFRFFSNYCMGY